MPNLELDFPLPDGSRPLPGFRLRRLEMLNWGTFHEKVAVLTPAGRWTLVVGENGSGKSTAVDALRTLLVPPRLLNYNDASGEQKRRHDRTRRSYIRGAWATSSQEESSAAQTQYLRREGEHSILLAVFANEHTGEEITLAQILWETNERTDEIYAIARADKSISEHLSNLGQSRELKKNLRVRGFECFDSFSAYSEVFRSRIGIPRETALEVFNQAIGVKEIGDINQFIRKHLLEGSNAADFIHKQLRPHFNELDACWRAIERAEKQLNALKPIAAAHEKSEEAQTKRGHLQELADVGQVYYAHRHLDLRQAEAEELIHRLVEVRARKEEIKKERERDTTERDAKLQEIAADSTEQSIARIRNQITAASQRQKDKEGRRKAFEGHLRTLNRFVPVETEEQFTRVREDVAAQQGLLEGNRDSAQQKQVEQLVSRQNAIDERARICAELESLRKNRVLIPRDFVVIRQEISAATGIAMEELPFAGELMEVKAEYREWTGAIERLLHQFGVSLLVPEPHYLAVAEYINQKHLRLRFTFHRVPLQPTGIRSEWLADTTRVSNRLNFREDVALSSWVKGEVGRRFNHVCCADVTRLKQVEYGITREGLIRDGSTRHTKDDRRAVNDASNYVLGWSVEDKIRAYTQAFTKAENDEKQATKKAGEAAEQFKKFEALLKAVDGVTGVMAFTDIDHETETKEIVRLDAEKRELEGSSERLKVLKQQLQAIEKKLNESEETLETAKKQLWETETKQSKNEEAVERLTGFLESKPRIAPETFADRFQTLQDEAKLTLKNVTSTEQQVLNRLQGQINHQTKLINEAREEMLPLMSRFLNEYPEHTANLQAEAGFAAEFASLRTQVEQEELPKHKQRFEEFLGTNLIGDMAMFQSNLLEHEKEIRQRLESVNLALRKIAFSDTTHVQIVAQATRVDEIKQFRAELKGCLAGGLQPTEDDRMRIFKNIRELIAKFEKDDVWTRRVTDARNWMEFGVRELSDAEGREVNYYSASSGKSGGQKAKLAFTILASTIAAQYGLLEAGSEANTFRLVVIDEVFARTDEGNSRRALKLFQSLGLQLVVVNPFDAKGRIVEDFVDSFHLTVNPNDNNSKIRRASREEYDAVVEKAPAPGNSAESIE